MNSLNENFIKKVRYRSKLSIILITINIALSSFYFGYHNNCFATLNIYTMIDIYSIPLSPSIASGVINGILPFFSILGAVITYHFVTKVSRRKILLYANCVAYFAGFIIFIKNFYTLLFARMLQGICIGCYVTMSPMIVRQLAPTEIAGVVGSVPQILMAFGCAFTCIFQYCLFKIFDDKQNRIIWVYVLGFPLLTLTIQTLVLLFVFPYETPKYLISIGDNQGAKRLIQILYINQFCQEVQMQKIEDFKAKIEHDKQISQLDDQIYGGHSIILKLKSNTSKMALIIAIVQQLSGINPASIYGYQIAKRSVESIRFLVPSIVNSIQFLGTLKASYLLYRFGRKDLFVYGTFALFFSLISVFIGLIIQDLWNSGGTFFILLGLASLNLFFGMTVGPCTWLYISEVADPQVVPYAVAVNRICAVVSITFFPIITASLLNGDCSIIFLIFGLIMFYFSYFYQKYLVQTKGKQEKQLRIQFKSLKFFN